MGLALPICASRQLPPCPQRGRGRVTLRGLRGLGHPGKVLDLDPRLRRRFLVGLIGLVILLNDFGDGDDGRDLHPLVALGVGLGGVVGVSPPLQNDVGRTEMVTDWSQDKNIC